MSLPVFFESPRRSRAVPVARLYLIKALLAVCALTLLLALPSHAQFGDPNYYTPSHAWGVTYVSQGSTSIVWLGTPDEYPARGGAWPVISNGGSIDCLYTFGEINETSHGSVTATLTWYPANGDSLLDPPDKIVYVRETATAEERPGLATFPDSNRPAMAGSVDDGLGQGDPVTMSGSDDLSSDYWQTFTQTGTRLLQCDGSSGKIVLDPVFLSAAAPVTSYASGIPDWVGSGWASVSFEAGQEKYVVTISASVDEDFYRGTHYKGLFDSTDPGSSLDTNGDPIYQIKQHIRKPTGAMSGDIGIPDSTDGLYKSVDIDYNAGRAGDWSLDGDVDFWYHTLLHSNFDTDHQGDTIYSWSPNISPFSVQYNGWADNPSIDPSNINERSTIGTDNVFFSYTDGHDGIKATAKYDMTVHRSIEVLKSNKHSILQTGYNLPENEFLRDLEISTDEPHYAIYGGDGVPGVWNAPGAFWGELAGAIGIAETIPIPKAPWLAATLEVAKIPVEDIADKGKHQNVGFPKEPGDPNAAPSPWSDPANWTTMLKPTDPNVNRSLYYFYPTGVHMRYKKIYTLHDNYDMTGFTGETQAEPLNVLQGPYSFYGHFSTHIEQ